MVTEICHDSASTLSMIVTPSQGDIVAATLPCDPYKVLKRQSEHHCFPSLTFPCQLIELIIIYKTLRYIKFQQKKSIYYDSSKIRMEQKGHYRRSLHDVSVR